MDYLQESERITSKLFAALNAPNWKLSKDSNGIKIHSAQSEYPEAGNMYKGSMKLEYSPKSIFTAIDPTKEYRTQWDTILDHVEILKEVHPNVYIVRHVSRSVLKGLLSPRDSYDLVTFGERDDCLFLSGATVDIDGLTTIDPKCIRAKQYPSGFIINKVVDHPDECVFNALTNMNLNMNVVTKYLSDIAKPTLMALLFDNLRDALPTFNLNSK